MGDQLRRVGYGNVGGDYGGNPNLHSTEVSLPFSANECRPGLPVIDNSSLGNEERTKVEASLQAGSAGALCGIDARHRPDKDVRIGFDGGSNTPTSI